MRIKKLTCMGVVLLLGITVFVQTTFAQKTEEVRFSVTVWDQSLKSVLQDIEQQTGFTIILDGQIKSDPISGFYNNTTVSDFLSIALEEKDIAVSTDLEKKRIKISKSHANEIAGQSPSRQEMNSFLESEAEYIIKAKQSVKQPTNEEIEVLYTDRLTGKPWHDVEGEIRLSPKQRKSGQEMNSFLESEADYIIKAKQSVKQPTNEEIKALHTDPLTGKAWHEVEGEIRLSPKRTRPSHKFSEADFLASESDYIESAQKAINNTQN